MSENDCVFCKMVTGEVPVAKVYEDEIVLAFLDIGPISDGHTLVIPKRHAPEYFDLSDVERRDVDGLLKFLKQQMFKKDP